MRSYQRRPESCMRARAVPPRGFAPAAFAQSFAGALCPRSSFAFRLQARLRASSTTALDQAHEETAELLPQLQRVLRCDDGVSVPCLGSRPGIARNVRQRRHSRRRKVSSQGSTAMNGPRHVNLKPVGKRGSFTVVEAMTRCKIADRTPNETNVGQF